MSQEYEHGIPIAGVGAGALNLSDAMIAGYHENYSAGDALNFGSVDLWYSSERHGLLFGSRHAVLDEQFFQEGNLARLLNAISLPEAPHVGVGIDSNTSVHLSDGTRLADVSGQSIVTIFDAETYHSAQGVSYKGSDNILSLWNIIFNTIASGNSAYELQRRQHSLRYPYPRLIRTFDSFVTPPDAGTLIIAGGLSETLADNPILKRFVELSGGDSARILVIAGGFPSQIAAKQAAGNYASALGVTTQTLVIISDNPTPIVIPEHYTGVLFIASDPAKLNQGALSPVRDAWLSGTPLLVDDGASAIVGNAYFDTTKPVNTDDESDGPERNWGIPDSSGIQAGINLVDINITPQIMADNNWGSWISLAYNQPEMLSLGISENTAVELSPTRRFLRREAVIRSRFAMRP
jgi:cyanophycinase